jgi:hypothetical protein
MKFASPSLPSLFALTFFVAVGGCAASEDDTGLGGEADAGSDSHGGTTDTGSTTTDSSSHTDTGSTTTDTGKKEGGGACVSHCTSNAECDSSCPASPTGSYNCCDTATGICYVSAGFCPAGSDGGGVDTSPY